METAKKGSDNMKFMEEVKKIEAILDTAFEPVSVQESNTVFSEQTVDQLSQVAEALATR